jgi:hypothetical protein
MDGRLATLGSDIEALSAVSGRFAGTEGELRMLDAVRKRLDDPARGEVEGFVAHTDPMLPLGIHAGLLLFCGVLGLWSAAVALLMALMVTLSLVAEGLGYTSAVRWLMLKAPSYNLVVPISEPAAIGTVVISAPLDVARWRWTWPNVLRWWRPVQAVALSGVVIAAMNAMRLLGEPLGLRMGQLYVAAVLVLVVTLTLGAVAHRRVGTGADDSTGPAVLLELLRRFDAAPPAVDVIVLFTGCGRAFQDGIRHFLALHDNLAGPVLVLSLDDPGRTPLQAVVAEGPLVRVRHRWTGPALVERLRWAGVVIPEVRRRNVTDAWAAYNAGYRAVALAGGPGAGTAEAAGRAADVAETIVRWYSEDVARVADDRSSLEELAFALSRRGGRDPDQEAL